MAATTSDSLSLAPQVAQATAAAGSKSLPPPAGGGCLGAWPSPPGSDGPDRLPLGSQVRL